MKPNIDQHKDKAEDGVEKLARAGFATKGVLYCVLGALSVQAAFSGASATGGKGAVRTIAAQPFGTFLLALTGLGLCAYALWRFAQAALDPEHKGTDGKGLAKRIGYAFSGVSHVALAVVAGQMLFGGGGGESRRTCLGELMASPGGQIVVGIL